MKCPKCEENIGFVEQIKEWDTEFGAEAGLPAMLMIMCDNCQEQRIIVQLIGVKKFETVKTPMGDVKIPIADDEDLNIDIDVEK
jgi:hypothetical protein